jgi:hypothetical protein
MPNPYRAPRPQREFSSLSVADVIEARDHYHVHLASRENVVATAIGRYRIRADDWYASHPPSSKPRKGYRKPTYPRTLFNSVVREWSWPCVLVFVDQWQHRGDLARPDEMVPASLYLPDGRVVPTCVIELSRDVMPVGIPHEYRFPKTFIGGGYPVLASVQGREHLGSVGCLVTDGDTTYALTNRHVVGESGREIYSILGGRRIPVGKADARSLGKKPFEDVYPDWPGERVYCNLDAGLIRVDDVSRWTTQVLGVGRLDTMLDLNTTTITLDLIDCPVRAFGAASGQLYGSIAGFFYRYKSVGGFDYVADLVIAPRAPAKSEPVTNTLPGDSGTLWCLEQPIEEPPGGIRLRPLALQWGGEVVVENGTRMTTARSFTLATALSTVCRELDLDLVRGWNSGLPEYWGAVGHYTIAAIACAKVAGAKLKKLMSSNAERVSYARDTIEKGSRAFAGLGAKDFVALADVPDYVWKGGGRSGEQPNHFADMDAKVPSGEWKGKTLLDLCKDPANVTVEVWKKYYGLVKDGSKGILPFRVWQIFEAMKSYARKKDVARFVAAAGVLSHYVGDACQPLHISYMYNGEPVPGGGTKRGHGVHHAYEAVMFNTHVAELWNGIEQNVKATPKAKITTGSEAALATIDLMRETFDLIEPKKIVDAYAKGTDLWTKFGDRTKETMANGVRHLAYLWEQAWAAGNGDAIAADKLVAITPARLATIYEDDDFLPSRRIKEIAAELT